jgi:DNA invertase Pin-like site-specific DNA recombinase
MTRTKTTKTPPAPESASRTWGYGRVSTLDQNLEAQTDALIAAGVNEKFIYVEKASTRLAVRPELEKLRTMLRPGDTIIVTKADRIARSTLDLLEIARTFDDAGVKLEILTGAFNRDDPYGKAMFTIAAAFAELERDLIQMRTNEGLAAARARGRVGGRKAKLTDAQAVEVKKMYEAREKTVAEIGELFGITRESVYRYVKA